MPSNRFIFGATRLAVPLICGVVLFAGRMAWSQETVRGKKYALLDQAKANAAPELMTTGVAEIKLKLVPAGEFLMGSPDNDNGTSEFERPQHRVRITRPFYLGVYEITQAQYKAVMGVNPSWFSSDALRKLTASGQPMDRHPVERVSWIDAVKFCNKLSAMDGVRPFYEIDGEKVRVLDWNGAGYRLPTEAEWEYACRAGTTARFSFGDDEARFGEFAWLQGNTGMTQAVGEKRANGFGLFDMHGNVWEWCWDFYDTRYYGNSPAGDPRGPDGPGQRTRRGGGYNSQPRDARSALRHSDNADLQYSGGGFRLARGQSKS
jgi:formylglycine-generating enzyme required for sulfatase activity